MSSRGGTGAAAERGDHPQASDPAPWIWPAGARGVLAGLASASALLLALFAGEAERTGAATTGAPTLRLDPNTAPPQVLGALPHLGPSLVRQLVHARELRPLSSLEDAGRRVRGLGPATRAALAPYLIFRDAAPLDLVDLEQSALARPGARTAALRRTKAHPLDAENGVSRGSARRSVRGRRRNIQNLDRQT